ncbi:HAUS augmin-like complex subunit 4 isoform X2 [Mycteria americana]|uniref:HAUS augmin-like complex subunit 4 isoform X2 n=1 Tax=Mycteria americana TaxID=33587 RepID=UPI003F581E2A
MRCCRRGDAPSLHMRPLLRGGKLFCACASLSHHSRPVAVYWTPAPPCRAPIGQRRGRRGGARRGARLCQRPARRVRSRGPPPAPLRGHPPGTAYPPRPGPAAAGAGLRPGARWAEPPPGEGAAAGGGGAGAAARGLAALGEPLAGAAGAAARPPAPGAPRPPGAGASPDPGRAAPRPPRLRRAAAAPPGFGALRGSAGRLAGEGCAGAQAELDRRRAEYLEAKGAAMLLKIRLEELTLLLDAYPPDKVEAHRRIRAALEAAREASGWGGGRGAGGAGGVRGAGPPLRGAGGGSTGGCGSGLEHRRWALRQLRPHDP